MSATRDKSQKTSFVYSNLYQIYRKGKEAASQAQVPAHEESARSSSLSTTSGVLKAEDLNQPHAAQVRVNPYSPAELISRRLERPAVLPVKKREEEPAVNFNVAPNPALESLKQNLKTLNDLHSRLRFMLEELEDLVKE